MSEVFRVSVWIKMFPVWLLALVLAGCGDKPQPLLMTSGDNYPENLSQWNVLQIDSNAIKLPE